MLKVVSSTRFAENNLRLKISLQIFVIVVLSAYGGVHGSPLPEPEPRVGSSSSAFLASVSGPTWSSFQVTPPPLLSPPVVSEPPETVEKDDLVKSDF